MSVTHPTLRAIDPLLYRCARGFTPPVSYVCTYGTALVHATDPSIFHPYRLAHFSRELFLCQRCTAGQICSPVGHCLCPYGQSVSLHLCDSAFWTVSVQFLPCDAVCTVSVIVILSVRPSVRPSVCLSVTLVDCVHMVRPTIMIFFTTG